MKSYLTTSIIAIVSISFWILFWSPWLGEDGGEDLIRKVQQEPDVKAELQILSSKYSYNPETGEGCDGLYSTWAPFGRTVRYCQYGTWYVTFWGQRF